MTDILDRCAALHPEFPDYVRDCAEIEFDFTDLQDPDPFPDNRVYFWFVEMFQAHHGEQGLAFRMEITRYVLDRWRARLRSYEPYRKCGYIVFMYETLAPKLDVFPNIPLHRNFPDEDGYKDVPTLEEMWEPYAKTYATNFWNSLRNPGPFPDILSAIKAEHGSIGTSAARRLGMSVAALRRHIEAYRLDEEVNAIRKRNGRRPARFVDRDRVVPRGSRRMWHEVWPANYRSAQKTPQKLVRQP